MCSSAAIWSAELAGWPRRQSVVGDFDGRNLKRGSITAQVHFAPLTALVCDVRRNAQRWKEGIRNCELDNQVWLHLEQIQPEEVKQSALSDAAPTLTNTANVLLYTAWNGILISACIRGTCTTG